MSLYVMAGHMRKIFGKINNTIGITSRIAAELVAEANKASKCNLTLFCNDNSADLKSIMNMMSLVIRDQDEFTIQIEGENEEAIEAKFTELLTQLKLMK